MVPITGVEKADLAVAEAVAPIRRTIGVRALGAVSEIADQPPLLALCAGLFAWGLIGRDRRLAATGGRMLAAGAIAIAMKSAVKHRIDRTRPHVADDGGAYAMKPGNSSESALNSFPSGHTAGAVAAARAFAAGYPEHRLAAYTLAAGIAAIQLPRCQHYASDLAAGAAIGIAAEACARAEDRLLARAS